MFRLSISLLLTIALTGSNFDIVLSLQAKQCDMTLEEVDQCGIRLIPFTNRAIVVPTNDDEMSAHCE